MSDKGRFRILWIILTLMIAAAGYLIAFNYYKSLELSKGKVLDRLKAITYTASLQIDPVSHQVLTAKWKQRSDSVEGTSEYRLIHRQLRSIQEVNQLGSPLNTLAYDSSYQIFQFIVTSSEFSNFKQDYIHFPKQLLDHYDQGSTLEGYESETGEWLSAFAPIKNSEGKTIGLIQADENCSVFIAQAHKQLMQQALIALFSVSPLVFLLFYFTRKFLQRQQEFEKSLHKQHQAIINQSKIIKSKNQHLVKKNKEVALINDELDLRVQRRTKELQATTDELKTYLYRSSHDMRGPLSSLLGLCRLMVKENVIEPYAKMIYDTSLRLIDRIQSLSDVYEIKSREIAFTKLDVGKLINEVGGLMTQEANANYVICRHEASHDEIFMEKDFIKMVLKEAIHNSIYHNRYKQSPTKIWVKACKVGEYLELEIRDDGLGMPQEITDKAFDMFFRGNEHSQGTGLGLFKVSMIVRRLCGTAELKSAIGLGTSLRIRIPLPEAIKQEVFTITKDAA